MRLWPRLESWAAFWPAALKFAKRLPRVRLRQRIKSAHFNFRRAGAFSRFAARQLPPSFFRARKCRPLFGRGFLAEEYDSGGAARCNAQSSSLTTAIWRRPPNHRSTMRLNGQAFRVVGIMPTTFDVPSGVDIWMPKRGSQPATPATGNVGITPPPKTQFESSNK